MQCFVVVLLPSWNYAYPIGERVAPMPWRLAQHVEFDN